MYLYHRLEFVRRMVPKLMKLNETNVPLKPVVSGPKYLKADVVQNLTRHLKKLPTVISLEDKGILKLRRISLPQYQHRHKTRSNVLT